MLLGTFLLCQSSKVILPCLDKMLDAGLRFRLRKTVAVVQLVSVLVDRLRVQLKQEQLNRVTKDETSRATE